MLLLHALAPVAHAALRFQVAHRVASGELSVIAVKNEPDRARVAWKASHEDVLDLILVRVFDIGVRGPLFGARRHPDPWVRSLVQGYQVGRLMRLCVH